MASQVKKGEGEGEPAVQPLQEGWQIPVVDLAELRGGIHRQLAIDKIALACEEWGFFHVVNHGISKDFFDTMWKALDVLFKVPLSERPKFDAGRFVLPASMKVSEEMKTRPKFGESRDTIRFEGLNPDDEGAIPLAPEQFRGPALECFGLLRDVGFELIDAISESLGLESDHIRKKIGNNPAINSSLHLYSPSLHRNKTIGLNPHKDIDVLTVLLQDETGGLQVLKGDTWVEVKPLPNSLVVNVGEVIQAITNGKYKSVMHRVENKDKARSSISCFLIPTPESMIEALPHLVSEGNPSPLPPSSWEIFFNNCIAKYMNK